MKISRMAKRRQLAGRRTGRCFFIKPQHRATYGGAMFYKQRFAGWKPNKW